MPVNMKCPTCGGPVYFEPQSGKMKCRYCSGETATSEFSQYEKEQEQDELTQNRLQQDNQQQNKLQQQKSQEDADIPGWKRRQMEMWGNKQSESVQKKEQTDFVQDDFGQRLVQDEVSQGVIGQRLLQDETSKEQVRENLDSDKADILQNKDEKAIDGNQDFTEEYVELNEYHCTSCGAKLMLNGTEASTFCGFCGSPTIVFDRVAKQLRPQKIIPFKITETQALDNIKERFKKGKYIPKKIRELTVEKVRGIYIPFWLYDSYIRRSMVIEVYHDEKKYYHNRDASCTYKKITMDASLNLSNSLSQRLEPYNMEDLESFEPAYLSGYYADIFDVPKDAVATAVQDRCRKFIDLEIVRSCHGVNLMSEHGVGNGQFDNYKMTDVRENYKIQQVEYALLPAYFINIEYKEGNELVLVNGQTGKVVGNLPIEKAQIAQIFTKYALISSIIMSFISILAVIMCANDSTGGVMFFAIPGLATFFSILGGISKYKKYKMDRFRINASNMRSYVDDREEAQL